MRQFSIRYLFGLLFIFSFLGFSSQGVLLASESEAEQEEVIESEEPGENPESSDSSEQVAPESAEQEPEAEIELSPEEAGYQGNWVKKREWLKQAQVVNTQIQEDAVAIEKAKKNFYDSFGEIDTAVDTFYHDHGVERGTVQAMMEDIERDIESRKQERLDNMKAKAERDGVPLNYYDMQVELVENEIAKLKRRVTQFEMDLDSIGALDESLKERLKVLDKHIDDARSEGERAEKLTKELWYVIDDNKARQRFYELKDKIGGRVASIRPYVEDVLLQDFKSVGKKLHEQISSVKGQIKELEEEGVIIERRSERLIQETEKKVRERIKKNHGDSDLENHVDEEAERRRSRRKRRKKLAQQATSWIEMVTGPVVTIFNSCGDYILAWVSKLKNIGARVLSFLPGFDDAGGIQKRRKRKRARVPDVADEVAEHADPESTESSEESMDESGVDSSLEPSE